MSKFIATRSPKHVRLYAEHLVKKYETGEFREVFKEFEDVIEILNSAEEWTVKEPITKKVLEKP